LPDNRAADIAVNAYCAPAETGFQAGQARGSALAKKQAFSDAGSRGKGILIGTIRQ
jgi:hypothetical protein